MPYRRLMWAEALELLGRAERLHRQFCQTAESPAGPTWEPPIDLFETDRGMWVYVALPGVPSDQIRVDVERGMLRITGHRAWPEELRGAMIWRLEVPHGRFERRVELPPGQFELEDLTSEHGCVTIYLRKR